MTFLGRVRVQAFLAATALLTPNPLGATVIHLRLNQPAAQYRSDAFEITRFDLAVPSTGLAGAQAALARPASFDPPDNATMLLLTSSGTSGQVAAGLQIRTRTTGQWSPWTELEGVEEDAPDGEPGQEGWRPDGAPVGLGPVWIGADTEEVQIAGLTSGAERGLLVEALAPLDRPADEFVLVQAPAQTAGLVRAQPAIQPRAAWADRGYECAGGPRYATNVRAGVVHHTVTTNAYSQADVPSILRGIYRLHVDVNGWCDIAYNFLIDRFGTIWEGRSGGIDRPVVGGHSKGLNNGTFGVALIGQHQAGASPAAASVPAGSLASLEAVLGWKFALHGVDPNGTTWVQNRNPDRVGARFAYLSWVQIPTLVGHRELVETSCPGSHAFPQIAGIRSRLMVGRVGIVPHDFPGHEPYEHGPGFVILDTFGGLRPGGSSRSFGGVAVPGGSQAVAVDGGADGGYILSSEGAVLAYGSSPAVGGAPAGANRPVDLIVRSGGTGGWVLDANGSFHAFGGAAAVAAAPAGGFAIAADVDDAGRGYVIAGNGLHAVGGAPARSLSVANAISVAVRSDRASGWVLDSAGRLTPFGGAPGWQPAAGVGVARTVVVGTNDRGGWVTDTEGRIIPFGEERRIMPTSTTVGVGHSVDAALVTWVTNDSSDLIRFTKALSTLFLGQSDPSSADVLAARVVWESRSAVVDELARSEAWAGRVVDQVYIDALGRAPDASGRTYWVQRLRAGLRVQDMGAFFYGSAEYYRSAGSNAGYVRRLYDALLQRPP
ncbi:MAG: N-acetylmuramoyl-L-alanine amidase, partial [Actinomycetota bacterium]|nr:N-acetylmuramoyl-L-alanine amidase [Actinomycetota bacterium]